MKTFRIHYHLYDARSKKHLNERQLAELSGISKSEINAIENQSANPTVTTICLLSLALGVAPHSLFSMEIID